MLSEGDNNSALSPTEVALLHPIHIDSSLYWPARRGLIGGCLFPTLWSSLWGRPRSSFSISPDFPKGACYVMSCLPRLPYPAISFLLDSMQSLRLLLYLIVEIPTTAAEGPTIISLFNMFVQMFFSRQAYRRNFFHLFFCTYQIINTKPCLSNQMKSFQISSNAISGSRE